MCAALDGRIIVIHPGDNQAFPHQIPCQETRCHFLDSVQRLLGTAAHFQVHLAVENMIPTPHSCRFHTSPTTMITYLRTVATDRIGLCLDTGHASIGSKHLSLSAVIQVCNTHLIALHLHDTDGTCDRHWIPGQGLVSWPRFFSALFTAGYSGKYTLEVEAPPGLSQADLTRYLIAARTELLEQLEAPSPPASRDVRFGPVPV